MLVLFASILVDKKIIDDSYHKYFADYQQCISLQNSDFELTYEINKVLLDAIDTFARKLDDSACKVYGEFRLACSKYKIDEIVSREIYRQKKMNFKWEPLYETALERSDKYVSYMDYLNKKRNSDQMEYLSESLQILDDNLFDTRELQYYGETPMRCVNSFNSQKHSYSVMVHEDLEHIAENLK